MPRPRALVLVLVRCVCVFVCACVRAERSCPAEPRREGRAQVFVFRGKRHLDSARLPTSTPRRVLALSRSRSCGVCECACARAERSRSIEPRRQRSTQAFVSSGKRHLDSVSPYPHAAPRPCSLAHALVQSLYVREERSHSADIYRTTKRETRAAKDFPLNATISYIGQPQSPIQLQVQIFASLLLGFSD